MSSMHRIAVTSALILFGFAATPSSQQAPPTGALATSVAELRTDTRRIPLASTWSRRAWAGKSALALAA